MSIFSSIGKFFKKVFSFIKNLLKKIISALGPFLPLLIIAAFVFAPWLAGYLVSWGFPGIGGLVADIYTVISGFGEYAMLATGVGVSFLIAPEETTKLINSIGKVIGTVVSAVGSAAGSAVSGLFSGLGWIGWACLGLGAYYLLKDDSPKVVVSGAQSD